ncbi:hypothetical protein EU546_07805 [Candidatus Thorarchaeota archaeon]|nr:MAG: hypothetical protein EU546_07805 [Candidatus Thorarchaeota archaeon]
MSTKFTPEVNVFSSDREVFRNNDFYQMPTFESVVASFLQLAEARLSDTQKLVLRASATLLCHHDVTVTALADMVSRRTDVPYSTTKWNLRSLMDLGLLDGGDSENRGRRAELSASARLLAHHLEVQHNE